MPISKECLDLFNILVNEYHKNPIDKDFQQIHSILTYMHGLLTSNPRAYKDDRVISFLSTSALLLEEDLFFKDCCKNFLMAYQQQTDCLDSLLDRELTIKNDLESWSINDEKKSSSQKSSSTATTPFFKELQEAINARQERIEIFGNSYKGFIKQSRD